MKTSGQLQKKATAQSAPIPVSTNLFHRPFSKPSATAEAASTDTPDFQARLDFARIHAPNLNSLAANSSGDRAPSTVQPKLTVGAPNDQYEQEADRVADQVMGMPDSATQQPIQREAMPEEEEVRTKPLAASITPLVQREAMPEEEEIRTKPIATLQREEIPEEEESVSLQRSPDGNLQAGEGIESRLNQSKGGGSPLSDEVRSFMEPRFGADFSQVRVHTGSDAVQMNRDLNAQAFAHKQDVYFGAGKAPAKDALTAHELTHVVQQTGKTQAQLIQRQSTAGARKGKSFTLTPHFGAEGGEVIGSGAFAFGLSEKWEGGREGEIIFGGVGLTLGTPFSVTGPGSSTTFNTPTSMCLEDFHGPGIVSAIGAQLGSGPSYSFLTFPRGVKVRGFGLVSGYGAGMSTYKGMWLLSGTNDISNDPSLA